MLVVYHPATVLSGQAVAGEASVMRLQRLFEMS